MRPVHLHEFTNLLHPVYTRAPDDEDRWVFGDKRFKTDAYQQTGETVKEPLHAEMVGHPSVRVIQTPDTHNTVQTVSLESQYGADVEISGLQTLANIWYGMLKMLSRGPLKPRDLRAMGNPYGYGQGKALTGWERLKHPNKGLQQPKRHFKGIRGSVANLDIVNIGSGLFERSWRWSVLQWYGGATLNFWNEAKTKGGAPYPWFLFHGTRYQQAHGPWGVVARTMIPKVMSEWRRATYQAYLRAKTRAMLSLAEIASPDNVTP
jgi:hypothetical protein